MTVAFLAFSELVAELAAMVAGAALTLSFVPLAFGSVRIAHTHYRLMEGFQ